MTGPPPDPLRLLITAGPSQEPLDAVRFMSNRSSGRLGIALAEASAARGWTTTLLLGPVAQPLPVHSHLHVHRFRTTDDLLALLLDHWPRHDVLIMAAAVADFRPAAPAADGKISRAAGGTTLRLEPTPDLLVALRAHTRADQATIGFALEPAERLLESAAAKLEAKGLDAIVANPLETMDSERITATVLRRDASPLSPPANLDKPRFAAWLLDHLDELAPRAASTGAAG